MLSARPIPPVAEPLPARPQPDLPPPAAQALPALTEAPNDPGIGAAVNNPLRKIAFWAGLAMIFIRVSTLPEILAYVTQSNTYLLYLVAPPALLGTFLCGGIQRTFRHRAPYWWMAFFAWMAIAAVFSSWRGGSFQRVMDYGRIDLMMLVIAGGLALTWSEIRALFYTLAAAGLMTLWAAKMFMRLDMGGRMTLNDASGTIGNSNDLAAHLLYILPFFLFIILDKKSFALIKFVLIGAIGYAFWIILGTGSRGALIASTITFLYVFWRVTVAQKMAMVITIAAIVLLSLPFIPAVTLNRLGTLVGSEHVEAEESSESRMYLFKKSVQFTIENPLFGVGPDQFANFEGNLSRSQGQIGNWHATHCAYTQISSECGIPALLFVIAALGSVIATVVRTNKMARRYGYLDIANATFCYTISMVAFLTAITFLSNAYRFYLPTMVGLGIALSFAARREMSLRSAYRPASAA